MGIVGAEALTENGYPDFFDDLSDSVASASAVSVFT